MATTELELQEITALPKKVSSQITATDYLMGIDSAEGYQMLIQDLGDYIIQKVTSSINGTNQTLAAAIAETKKLSVGKTIAANTDLNDIKAVGSYTSINSTITNSLAHSPIAGAGFSLDVAAINSNTVIMQTLVSRVTGSSPSIYRRSYYAGSDTWDSDWIKDPVKSDIDALNSKLFVNDGGNITQSNIDNLKDPCIYSRYIEAATIVGNSAAGNHFGLLIVTNVATAERVGQYIFMPSTGYIAVRYNSGGNWSIWRGMQLPVVTS